MQSFIARQPIFDTKQRVYAYELLFRSSLDNVCDIPDLNYASTKIITDSCMLLGMENITGGKKAFINTTRDVLLKDCIDLLPRELSVIEILETVEPDEEVLRVCSKLKQQGYLLALDDFSYREEYNELINLVDIIKVDFLQTSREEQRSLVERFAPRGIRFLAEKVETQVAFEEAQEMGYVYFQGYFFCRPMILTWKDVPGFKLHYLNILREIHRPELDFGHIEEIIKRDVSLSYKLLRYINSAFFSWRVEINSIRQALILLGEKEVRKWASLIALASMSKDKPEELVAQAVIRAKFCESMAPLVGLAHRAEDLFLMGMFSLVDAILDRELKEILRDMPIADDVKAALLDERYRSGAEGARLKNAHECVLAYERADWPRLEEAAKNLGMSNAALELPRLYLQAVGWVQKSLPREPLESPV